MEKVKKPLILMRKLTGKAQLAAAEMAWHELDRYAPALKAARKNGSSKHRRSGSAGN